MEWNGRETNQLDSIRPDSARIESNRIESSPFAPNRRLEPPILNMGIRSFAGGKSLEATRSRRQFWSWGSTHLQEATAGRPQDRSTDFGAGDPLTHQLWRPQLGDRSWETSSGGPSWETTGSSHRFWSCGSTHSTAREATAGRPQLGDHRLALPILELASVSPVLKTNIEDPST